MQKTIISHPPTVVHPTKQPTAGTNVQLNRDRSQQPGKRIAYILGAFPALTTTFIDREILEAKRVGVKLTLVAIRRSAPFVMAPEVQALAAATKYILPAPWAPFLYANLYFGLIHARRYFFTLAYLLTRRHHSFKAWAKTILHFAEGVWAAHLLRSEAIEHLHAHFADRAAIVALVAARLLKVPYSLTAHANDIYATPALLQEKVANAKFVTTCTGFNKAYLERVTGCPVELVYHGLDLTKISDIPRPAPADQLPLILAVGQLKEKKGLPYLIRACSLLKHWGYAFRCEIVGEGPEHIRLQSLIEELKLAHEVTLTGALPHAEVMQRYACAMLFVLPSVVAGDQDRDGIPNVLLEAMANGVPVISTRVSGIPEIIKDQVTGLLVEPGDAEGAATAIAYLLDHPHQRACLAAAGRTFVEEQFDIRQNIEQLVTLLEM